MSRPLEFFDTNVFVAATVKEHIHHRTCAVLIARLGESGGGACATHTLAETYTTLTRTSSYGLPPIDVAMALDHASKMFKLVSLTVAEYVAAIEAAALLGLPGPIVYDALLMACARKIDATAIYTHNVKHFRKVAPDLAERIVAP